MDTELAAGRWHALEGTEVVRRLGSDPAHGLARAEALARRERFGPNEVTPRGRTPAVLRFLEQFHQPLVYILLVAAIITAALREWLDAAVITGVVLVNTVIGFVQESRALTAIDALSRRLVAEATVVRDGERRRVPAADVVPGDLVCLGSGDKVPADIRLLWSRDLEINESALTGESLPVAKHAAALLEEEAPLADRVNLAYASTVVTHGAATGVVVATGDGTEVGHISRLIATAEDIATPLTRKINHFSHVLLTIILGLSVGTFVIGLARGAPAFDMFMAAVALMVATIPEGLPAAITIVLALGVARMAKRRAIIRKLPAVETLGSTTIICSDKTGTLTQNQMTVTRVRAGSRDYDVSGTGYAPEGELCLGSGAARIDDHPALRECLRAGLLCNDARLVEEEGRFTVEGDPTEGALLVLARKAGLGPHRNGFKAPRIDAIPFESDYQYMATLHPGAALFAGARHHVVYVKGSVEAVLARSTCMLDDDGEAGPIDKAALERDAEDMAAEGLRVLAFARGRAPEHQRTVAHDDVLSGLTFLGFVGMIDPPREEARAAIDMCRHAGIAVKMITGDHALTAGSIAAQLHLDGDGDGDGDGNEPWPQAVTGRQLEALPDRELGVVAEESAVFARVTPEQKLRLVKALQERQHVVAMTGDGVNDAPALRQADIGIAMGCTGTDVAKEAADMVLTDDNFTSIEAAVEEGRGVFDNLTKFIVWTIPTNLGEGLLIVASIVLGAMLPVLPLQVLWINMTTAALLGLTLAFEPKEPGVMERPPRRTDRPILTLPLALRTLLVGGFILLAGYGLFALELFRGASLASARTAAVNVVVFVQVAYLFNCRSLDRPLREVGMWTNPWVFAGAASMIALQLLFTYLPAMNSLFASAPIAPSAWLVVAAAGAVLFGVVTLEKRFTGRMPDRLPVPARVQARRERRELRRETREELRRTTHRETRVPRWRRRERARTRRDEAA